MSKAGMNAQELRSYFSDMLIGLKEDKVRPDVARAAASVAGKILQSAKLELDFKKSIGALPKIEFLDNSEDMVKKPSQIKKISYKN